jgi:hypothetical protein
MDSTQVGQILDAISKRLQLPAAMLWQALIRQVYVEAITDGILLILGIIAVVIWTKWFRWARTKRKDDGYGDRMDRSMPCFVAGGVIGIFLAVVVICAVADFAQLANPEYGALKILLSAAHAK